MSNISIISHFALKVNRASGVGDGGNPELTWSEFDGVALLVFKFDLRGDVGFAPGAFDDGAVLEDVSLARIGDIKDLVVAVSVEPLIDFDDGDGTGGELDFGAVGARRGLFEAGGTIVRGVAGAVFPAAVISVGSGIVGVGGIEVGITAEADDDVVDGGGFRGGVFIRFVLVGSSVLLVGCGGFFVGGGEFVGFGFGFFGLETGEGGEVGSIITVVAVELIE